MEDDRQELAHERTELAQKRTVLAEERNFSAWIRTGLASVAAGFAAVKLMREGDPEWLVRALGVAFTIAGGTMIGMGFWRYRRDVQHKGLSGHRGVPEWIVNAVVALIIAGVGAALLLIFLHGDP